MLVKDIFHKPTFVESGMTIEAVAEIMAFKDIGSVIVGTADKPEGIFSERDILKKIVSKGVSPKQAKVAEYMTSPIITIDADKPVTEAMKIITEHHIKRLPVVFEGKIIGMLTARSIMENVGRSIINEKISFNETNSRKDTPGFW